MPELRVSPEDLQVSAATVDVHAGTVRTRHAAADGQIEGAQRGMPAGAAVALGAAVTKWQTDTAALASRLLARRTRISWKAQQRHLRVWACGAELLQMRRQAGSTHPCLVIGHRGPEVGRAKGVDRVRRGVVSHPDNRGGSR